MTRSVAHVRQNAQYMRTRRREEYLERLRNIDAEHYHKLRCTIGSERFLVLRRWAAAREQCRQLVEAQGAQIERTI